MKKMSEKERYCEIKRYCEMLQTLLKWESKQKQNCRKYVLKCAIKGDWAPLGNYVRDGDRITPEIRSFLVDVLSGKITKPRKKVSRAETLLRNIELVRFVWEARQRGDKNVPQQAVNKFGRTWRQLQKILAAMPDRRAFIEQQTSRLNAIMRLMEPIIAKEGGLSKRGVPKYTLGAMALTPHTLP